jgi:hypothetical protein
MSNFDSSKITDILKAASNLLATDKSASPEMRAMMMTLIAYVTAQAEQLQLAKEQILALRDEISILKGEKPRPKIKKSILEGKNAKDEDKDKNDNKGKRPGSTKRSKTAELVIHETVKLTSDGVGHDWIFKGYKDVIVQGLVIKPHNTRYQRACWLTPSGEFVIAPLPKSVIGHFDSTLISYIQHQYFACRVTQPLLLEQMREIGIDISSGQLNEILTENKEAFHKEKDAILAAGLAVSEFIQTDDTGARHKGKNGYCTCISNDFFAFYSSTGNKSRINFLEILRTGHEDYVINEDSEEYMKQQHLPQSIIALLMESKTKQFSDHKAWKVQLDILAISSAHHVRIATESALLGSALAHGLSKDLIVLSDDAGQFNILQHALCWIHAERTIHKLIGFTDEQRAAIDIVRDQIWTLYKKLKTYKSSPSAVCRFGIENDFNAIFTQKTCFVTLNLALERIAKNKNELLRVLDHPNTPLHNNGCETDVRDRVSQRKISGGTQSYLGRRARDTFASLKRTCRKLGVSFWKFLNDRNAAVNNIPQLSQLIMEKSAART